MTWQEFQLAGLRRLCRDLHDEIAYMSDVDKWLAKCGRPPSDPVRQELASLVRYIDWMLEVVWNDSQDYMPYRPFTSPWKNQGLSAVLRPDFARRGIVDRED